MKVKEYKRTRNKLGGVHVQETIKEVPDPIDHNKIFLAKFKELIARQEKIAEKLGVE
ncbi:hypothetical protein [Thermococcus sp.]|uniref:hypothetical protein n=1 Tax=Thermococcus sp. TaxID=35749 RepID=UPI00260CBBAC|nr:hypothetical protein [Thermococcus sp.]MCD6143779.1 hypothetical protein [Thermococcus sp.]